MTKLDHSERALESLICDDLTSKERAWPWLAGDPAGFDAELALYSEDVVTFLETTQGQRWQRLVSLYGGQEQAVRGFCRRLAKELDRRGAVEVCRRGMEDRGQAFKLCYFRPAHSADQRSLELYKANRMRVVRQVRFDPKSGESVDLVLCVNGIPTATAELKNLYTHQTVADAMKQYRDTRDPRLALFSGRRAFVHFAVDTEQAYMTTKLAKDKTEFLPFNQGSGGPGEPGGKGNPPDPAGHRTSYLWRQIWDAGRWLELIQKFVFTEQPAKPKDGGKASDAKTIFPRYHQWDVVAACSAHARDHGAGENYLIQHSAGSGKTKEIAWLAHELSVLHDTEDRKVFDKVVVITDRRVLDAQLQAQVRAFEQTKGVVESIDQDSAQLRRALEGEQARIIVTTLQKFPFVLAQLGTEDSLKHRRYAMIVDEAHSSQTGESATDLKAILGSKTIEDLELDEEEQDGVPTALLAQLAARGRQPNLSFFAFTATPKPKTLELFGTKETPGGNPRAFHIYSMEQAVEEGFILDVLQNYTTYQQLYRLENKASEELEVPSGKAGRRLARYAELHPYALDQKAQVIVDHYEQVVRPMLGGTAKAMVVTASRHDAVRYKQALDRVIEKGQHPDVRTLVAFSGEVTITDSAAIDHGEKYTEPQMNKGTVGHSLPMSQLPTEFDKDTYGVLVVAEKYQTGFDQPKLCAMYVDKPLTGVNVVQTLSRINRTHAGKKATYVVDFVNDTEQILAAFKPFYGKTEATPTDPNVLFDAAQKVRDFDVLDNDDINAFAQIYFDPASGDHGKLTQLTDPAFEAAKALDEDDLLALREAIDRFERFYAFLSQIIPFVPPDTEKLYVVCRFLADRLQGERPEGGVSLSGTVDLTHYRLEKLGTETLELSPEGAEPGTAIHGDGTGSPRSPGEVPLSLLGEIVELFNARYGADLSDEDLVRPAQHMVDKVAAHADLEEQARRNDYDDFRRGKDGVVLDAALDVKGINDLFFRKFLEDEDLRERVSEGVLHAVYERLTQSP